MESPLIMVIQRVLSLGYGGLGLGDFSKVERLGMGKINLSFMVDDRYVLQRLNPIFGVGVCDDIAELVEILLSKGVSVPRLIKSHDGWGYYLEDEVYGGVWRLMERLEGKCIWSVENVDQARSLGEQLGLFHSALVDVNHVFRPGRRGVHCFRRHWEALESAMEVHHGHQCYEGVRELYESIKQVLDLFMEEEVRVQRILHGDPNVTNFLFIGDEVSGVIDLDTMGYGYWDDEMGDALRSWVDRGDGNREPELEVSYYESSMDGYYSVANWVSQEERLRVGKAARRIAAELSVRFARDALCEDYFGYDLKFAPSHGEHSLLRAQNQWKLSQAFGELL